MLLKSKKLEGKALDWAVARCNYPDSDMSATHVWLDTGDGEDDFLIHKYSIDREEGGLIIERQGIGTFKAGSRWAANWTNATGSVLETYGPTPLIAGLRCYVLSQKGEEVDIPEKLLC